MTIVGPNQNKDLKRCWFYSTIGVGAMVVVVLLSYLSLVGLRHDLRNTRDSLEAMKVQNAELKNNYYQLISTESLESLAEEKGLIKDKNPEWALVSQL